MGVNNQINRNNRMTTRFRQNSSRVKTVEPVDPKTMERIVLQAALNPFSAMIAEAMTTVASFSSLEWTNIDFLGGSIGLYLPPLGEIRFVISGSGYGEDELLVWSVVDKNNCKLLDWHATGSVDDSVDGKFIEDENFSVVLNDVFKLVKRCMSNHMNLIDCYLNNFGKADDNKSI
jgi:hypothetical protein